MMVSDPEVGVPDKPPPRPIMTNDYPTQAAYEQAVAEHKQLMALRRKAQDKLHQRAGRARPSEEARKLTPEERQTKSAANKAARDERSRKKQPMYEQHRRDKREAALEVIRAAVQQKRVSQAAAAAEERAAFDAECAERARAHQARQDAARRVLAAHRSWPQCARCAFMDKHSHVCVHVGGCSCMATAAQAADEAGLHCLCGRCGELVSFCDCPAPEEEPARARNWTHPAFRNAERAFKDLLKALWYERITGELPRQQRGVQSHFCRSIRWHRSDGDMRFSAASVSARPLTSGAHGRSSTVRGHVDRTVRSVPPMPRVL